MSQQDDTIAALKEAKASIDAHTIAIEIVGREVIAATREFTSQLGTLNGNMELVMGYMQSIGKRLGVTEQEVEQLTAARIVAGTNGNGGENGNGHGNAE